jgi:hypothetical protein
MAELVPQLTGWSKVRVVGGDRAVRAGDGPAEPGWARVAFWVGSLIQWAVGAVFLGLATWRVTRSWRVVEAEGAANGSAEPRDGCRRSGGGWWNGSGRGCGTKAI